MFPGVRGEAPYEASAPTRPTTFYGETKLDGEKAVLEAYRASSDDEQTSGTEVEPVGGKTVVVRVPVLYGDVESSESGMGNKESAVNTLLDTVWKAATLPTGSSPLKIDDWSQRYPTNTEDVARVLRDIATQYTAAPSSSSASVNDQPRRAVALPQILQFSAEERFTKYEICKVLAEILDVSLEGKLVGEQPPEEEDAGGGGGGGGGGGVQRPYDTHLSTASLKDLGISVNAQDFRAWWRWRVKAFRK